MFEELFDSLEEGIFVINGSYDIVKANKAILHMFDKGDVRDIQGRKCFREYYQRDAACENCPAEKTFREGVRGRLSRVVGEIGKREVVLDKVTFPVKDETGNVVQVIECVKDVAHVVKLEEQLLFSERLAGLGKLAAGIAHEIRNPLSNIRATAQFCLDTLALDEGMRKYLRTILRSSDRMNRVVRDLLHLAKPGEASFKVDSVTGTLNNVCNLVDAKCLRQRVRLKKRFSRRLPPVLLDEKLLEEAFLNLVLNALDAMPQGGRLTIITCYAHDTEEIVISFVDSGCGIQEEQRARVFDPFFTTKKDGTGLGLYLTRQIIELHKGSISVESKKGYGAEVTVRLPVHK